MGKDGEGKIGNYMETGKNIGLSENCGDAFLYGKDMYMWCWGDQGILHMYNGAR